MLFFLVLYHVLHHVLVFLVAGCSNISLLPLFLAFECYGDANFCTDFYLTSHNVYI